MNTELRKMIVAAEGRYLHESEIASVRSWAIELRARLDAVARLAAREDAIVEEAMERFLERHPDFHAGAREGRARGLRDFRLTLRYLGSAHVRDDEAFYRSHFSTWFAELLLPLMPAELLVESMRGLRDALESQLDAADGRCFVRYLDIFLADLER
jgi:hypothetical protein